MIRLPQRATGNALQWQVLTCLPAFTARSKVLFRTTTIDNNLENEKYSLKRLDDAIAARLTPHHRMNSFNKMQTHLLK
jgi:hypothetical protein